MDQQTTHRIIPVGRVCTNANPMVAKLRADTFRNTYLVYISSTLGFLIAELLVKVVVIFFK